MDPQSPPQDTNNTPAPAAPAASAAPLGVPSVWPGASGIYKYSKSAVQVNLGAIIAVVLISAILSGGPRYLHAPVSGVISFLLYGFVTIAATHLYLASVRGQKLGLGDAIKKSLDLNLYLKLLGLLVLTYIALIISLLLLIVPFFFVAPRLILAPYFLIDQDLGVMEALSASWEHTKGHAGKVWGIIGVTIVFAILFIVIIGIYFYIMYAAAFALLYEFIKKTSPAVPAATAAPTPPPAEPAV